MFPGSRGMAKGESGKSKKEGLVMNGRCFYAGLIVFLLTVVGIVPAVGQDDPAPPELPGEAYVPGRVEGTGTHFEITDSEYLNITL